MARTIEEIKEGIAADFMNNDSIAELYDFPVGDSFSKHFSKVSIINLLFYIFASASWLMEELFEEYKKDVEEIAEEILPHRPKWYRDMALKFMVDKELIEETDKYDTSTMTQDEIEAAQVVKNAVAIENPDASILTIKVKGEEGKLDNQILEQLSAYLDEIKDAGVRINLLSLDADIFDCEVNVYYNPMMSKETVQEACDMVIRQYVENLPFNGEYSNMTLIDHVQKVEGVKIAEVSNAFTRAATESVSTLIHVKHIPLAGYYAARDINLIMTPYE